MSVSLLFVSQVSVELTSERCAPRPLPSDLQHLPETPAGPLLHLRHHQQLCSGYEEDVAGLTALSHFARQTPVTRGSPTAGRRPAGHPGLCPQAVSSR